MKEKLTQETYMLERKKIFEQLRQLNERYIADNTDIEPGTMVMVNGLTKCKLKGYQVTNGYVYPILLQVNERGKVVQNRYHVSHTVKLTRL